MFSKIFKRVSQPKIMPLPEVADRIYAIGDIHGDFDHYRALEEEILKDASQNSVIILLGDLIDRGPLSAHLFDHLTDTSYLGPMRIALMGNHEAIMRDILDGKSLEKEWKAIGGLATLDSYDMDFSGSFSKRVSEFRRTYPQRHRDFLDAMPHAVLSENILLSHAGGDPEKSLDAQSVEDLITRRARAEDHLEKPKHGRLSIHGHTAVQDISEKPWAVNLDTSKSEERVLSAISIDTQTKNILNIFKA
jgi:serine/threonine protein phosphatase 1